MSTTYKLTYQQRREIVERYESGEKVDAIAADFSVDRAYPGKLAHRWGARRRKDKRSEAAFLLRS